VGSLHRSVFAVTPPNGHQGSPGTLQSRSDAGKVQIHQTWPRDEFTYALDALAQNIIRHSQCDVKGHGPSYYRQQAIIGDHDERMDTVREDCDALLSYVSPTCTFEGKRAGNGRDDKGILLPGDVRNHWSGSRSRTTSHASSYEDGVCAQQRFADDFPAFLRCTSPPFWVPTHTQSLGSPGPELESARCLRLGQSLSIGIGRYELHASQPCLDHAIDRIATSTSYTDHFDGLRRRLPELGPIPHSSTLPFPANATAARTPAT
jgi:hypothetical protein